MHDTFYLDGENAEKYGIRLQRPISFSGAVPVVKSIKVPGRNGALTLATGAYENRKADARCYALQTDVSDAVISAGALLLSRPGYRRLETSNDPDHFWLARVTNGPEVDDRMQTLNPFRIKFDCMPQRFLKSGEVGVSMDKPGALRNPGSLDAKPIIRIYGNGVGTLTVGQLIIKINALTDKIILDSDTGNAYNDSMNLNKDIDAPEFPILRPGVTPITWGGGISAIVIIPRWADL